MFLLWWRPFGPLLKQVCTDADIQASICTKQLQVTSKPHSSQQLSRSFPPAQHTQPQQTTNHPAKCAHTPAQAAAPKEMRSAIACEFSRENGIVRIQNDNSN